MIKVENISKSFNNKVKAVDNLSFTVNDGEIVGFIGPNGAGKTTTMKMMTGILPIENGDIFLNDYSIKTDTLKAKEILGYIADSPDMFLRLKGIDFLNFIADIYKISLDERKERIKEFAGKFDLEKELSQTMQSYSHGMRQKMMVIAALVHNPAVWILDEPLIGLDPKSAYELKSMMRNHADKGNSVLFSTHILEVAEKLCDKVVIINKGRSVFMGTLDDLKLKYQNKTLEEIFLTLTN